MDLPNTYRSFLFIDNSNENDIYNFKEVIEERFNDTKIYYITNKKIDKIRKYLWSGKNCYYVLPLQLFPQDNNDDIIKIFMKYFGFFDIYYIFKQKGEYVVGNVSFTKELNKNIKVI